jgi:hypothetical protein
MRKTGLWMLGLVVGVGVACSANSDKGDFGPGAGGEGAGQADSGPGAGGTGGTGGDPVGDSGGGFLIDAPVNTDSGPAVYCPHADDQDHDGDGYSFEQGDCNDCDPNANPGAYDVIGGIDGGPGADEDCNGTIDDEPMDCDQGIDIATTDAMAAARAIGLCRVADPNATGKDRTWGVLSAKFVKVDGTPGMAPLSHGVLPQFGVANPQHGATMLALSSGTARAPGQPGYQSSNGATMNTNSQPPAGYPKESPACPGVTTGGVFDPAALEVVLRVPTNARSFTFNLNFYTFEFPQYICSEFNDFYVTMMWPPPPGLPDANISFDQDGNPISVNNSLLQVCVPQQAGGKNFPCPLGPGLLQNTGFTGPLIGSHAATGWLQTRAPVEPGSEVTLRFAIWDSGDPVLDSLVLIDNFLWSLEAAVGSSTEPVPVPK